MSYSKALKYTGADNVSLEYNASHAYASVFDNADIGIPGNQTIIDPWVSRTGLRKDNPWYMGKEGNQKATTNADGANWYYTGYTQGLLTLYGRQVGDATYGQQAAYGKKLAEDKKAQGAETF